jgi:hypothetical protein
MRIFFLAAAMGLAACSSDPDDTAPLNRPSGSSSSTDNAPPPTPPTNDGLTCDVKPPTRKYTGFGKVELTADRVNENIGVNRARLKPYAVLASEYHRALGQTPSSLASEAATFGEPEARWYEEMALNAVSVSTAYDVAFEGCLAYTQNGADFAAAPTVATSVSQCTAMMQKFWNQTPGFAEVKVCSDFAVTGLPPAESNPRRRWAYVCAAVLSSTHFLAF